MGLSSAYSWLQGRVNSSFGSTPPPNMSLNSNSTNLGTPIKIDLSDPGPMKVYNPIINGITDGIVTSNIFNGLSNAVRNGISINVGDLTKPKVTTSSGGHSASEVYSAPVTPAQLDYLNAELASHYGMSKETAYQEALSNTAYQRSVRDMQLAGLNPAVLYGSGKGSPSDGVYYVGSPSSSGGSSGGYNRRSSGSSNNNGKLFSTGEFYGISAAAGLVSALISKNPNTYWIGQTVAQGFMTAANSLLKK